MKLVSKFLSRNRLNTRKCKRRIYHAWENFEKFNQNELKNLHDQQIVQLKDELKSFYDEIVFQDDPEEYCIERILSSSNSLLRYGMLCDEGFMRASYIAPITDYSRDFDQLKIGKSKKYGVYLFDETMREMNYTDFSSEVERQAIYSKTLEFEFMEFLDIYLNKKIELYKQYIFLLSLHFNNDYCRSMGIPSLIDCIGGEKLDLEEDIYATRSIILKRGFNSSEEWTEYFQSRYGVKANPFTFQVNELFDFS
jgi:hypothetical protein